MPDPAKPSESSLNLDLPQVDPRRSVFINCPYDVDYEPLFDALIFTIVCCGFIPRSATESGKVSIPRMDRIFHAILTSSYSIHDLSRCHGEGEQLLARFNMPLELGIAMSRRRLDNQPQPHDWLVLVPSSATYARFISDLAGYDPQHYDGKGESLVRCVTAWLLPQPGAIPGIKPTLILGKLEKFRKEKNTLRAEYAEIPWHLLVEMATQTAPRL